MRATHMHFDHATPSPDPYPKLRITGIPLPSHHRPRNACSRRSMCTAIPSQEIHTFRNSTRNPYPHALRPSHGPTLHHRPLLRASRKPGHGSPTASPPSKPGSGLGIALTAPRTRSNRRTISCAPSHRVQRRTPTMLLPPAQLHGDLAMYMEALLFHPPPSTAHVTCAKCTLLSLPCIRLRAPNARHPGHRRKSKHRHQGTNQGARRALPARPLRPSLAFIELPLTYRPIHDYIDKTPCDAQLRHTRKTPALPFAWTIALPQNRSRLPIPHLGPPHSTTPDIPSHTTPPAQRPVLGHIRPRHGRVTQQLVPTTPTTALLPTARYRNWPSRKKHSLGRSTPKLRHTNKNTASGRRLTLLPFQTWYTRLPIPRCF